MAYGSINGVKDRFAMALSNLQSCKIGTDSKKASKCNAVDQDMREDVVCFDREAMSAHDIGFRDVKISKISDAGSVAGGKMLDIPLGLSGKSSSASSRAS